MKTLSYALNIFFLLALAAYFLFFRNPQNPEQENLNAVWAQFGQEVTDLGALVENAPFNTSEATAAEGYRHMARFIAAFIATRTDYSDPNYPNLSRFPNNVSRIGWDNPDNPYLSARLRGDHRYRLRGNIRNFELATLTVYSGMLGLHPIQDIRTRASVISDELDVDADGNFELILSAERDEDNTGNWLALAPDAYMIVIRRLVTNWDNTDEGDWEFINLTTLGRGAPLITADEVTRSLRDASKMAKDLRNMLTLAHRAMFLTGKANSAPAPKQGDPNLPMADPNQSTTRFWFDIADDEALIITAPPTDCRYTNIQLANPWMESLDYASHQSSLNSGQTKVDTDGQLRYVVAKQDPGVANWLDTAGHNQGSAFMRWTVCGAYPSSVDVKHVKLSELAAHLPNSTARQSPAQRAETIAKRQRAISRRYAGG